MYIKVNASTGSARNLIAEKQINKKRKRKFTTPMIYNPNTNNSQL
jgi:hypothetical protein